MARSTDATRRKVALAYSGGLDTSVAIRWLQKTKDLDVVALTLDLGQDQADLDAVMSKARTLGCVAAYAVDAKDEFARDFVTPAIWANALYGGSYPLATALGRPLIARHLVNVAHKEGAEFVAHGSTAKGNDQVRIEVAVGALDPSLTMIAPMREWLYTRDEAVAYAHEHGIPVPVKAGRAYSVDENLWGRSVESGPIEDTGSLPPEDAFAVTVAPAAAPNEPEDISIGFEAGTPTSLNGVALPLPQLIAEAARIAGKHGVGRIDQVEDRLVGIKSREIYEAPAAAVILRAHRELESLTLTKDVLHFKPFVEQAFATQTYNGLFFSPLMDAMTSFLRTTQSDVDGNVTLRLYKAGMTVVARESPRPLYSRSLATYGEGDRFDHEAAKGFIEIWGLPLRVAAQRDASTKETADEVRTTETTA